jgi:tetratricopeptide (TPR) repeat protein
MVPDPAQRQLMMRGIAEMGQQELESAMATFTRLIEVAPDLSEAWNKRATVHWLLGNFRASIADICETVKREPRHFGAYSGLGMIRAQMGEHAHAAAAFELARKWNPHIAGLDAEIERQKAEAGGEVSDDPLGCGQQTAGR